MTYVIATNLQLETEECYMCAVVFAMPKSLRERFLNYGGDFYCPNGHAQHYTKTEVQRLREKLEEQTRVATNQAERAQSAENKIKRMEKRTSAGVCTCCNRTFQQLARHMKTKHPEHVERCKRVKREVKP